MARNFIVTDPQPVQQGEHVAWYIIPGEVLRIISGPEHGEYYVEDGNGNRFYVQDFEGRVEETSC